MLDFMHEGGFAMWPALVVALVSVGWAWTSPLAQRAGVLCGGAVLVVSQFTLLGDVRRGRRPSFTAAAQPEEANQLYESYCQKLMAAGIAVGQ